MNSYDFNYTMSQNQRPLYPNYIPNLMANSIQVQNIINNSRGNTPQYNLPRPIRANSNVQGYNPVNIIPSQINPAHQILVSKSNIISSPQIQNKNVIQPQFLMKNNQNMIHNQSKENNINTNSAITNQDQIQIKKINQ